MHQNYAHSDKGFKIYMILNPIVLIYNNVQKVMPINSDKHDFFYVTILNGFTIYSYNIFDRA